MSQKCRNEELFLFSPSCADFILKLEDNQTYDYYPMDRNGIEKTKRYFYDAYAKGAMEC